MKFELDVNFILYKWDKFHIIYKLVFIIASISLIIRPISYEAVYSFNGKKKQICVCCENLYFLMHIWQNMSCILINLIKFHLSKHLIIDWLQNITIILFKLAITLNFPSLCLNNGDRKEQEGCNHWMILRCRDP